MKKTLTRGCRWLGISSLALMLSGCNFWLFDPKGPIAHEQMWLIIICALVMLIVVIPVTIMGVWFPVRYAKGKRLE